MSNEEREKVALETSNHLVDEEKTIKQVEEKFRVEREFATRLEEGRALMLQHELEKIREYDNDPERMVWPDPQLKNRIRQNG